MTRVWTKLSAFLDRIRWWRRRPRRPDAGVREPRRPKPTLPTAAVALAEPRTELRRWLKLRRRA
jgi:hypothetical protein